MVSLPWIRVLGFIQKPTFEKTGFQIPVFAKKNRLKPVFEFLQKNVIKSKKIFTLLLKYVFNVYGNTKI
jgi:hypothetical protein